jgi:hypothetical protein
MDSREHLIEGQTLANGRLHGTESTRALTSAESEWGDIAMPPHDFGEVTYPPPEPPDRDENYYFGKAINLPLSPSIR